MLWKLSVVLTVFWLAGFALHFGPGVMDLLIVLAIIVLLYKLIADTLQPYQESKHFQVRSVSHLLRYDIYYQ